jgi:2-C-methyl-D-erythritol 4-phosphate cytidylyltransferase
MSASSSATSFPERTAAAIVVAGGSGQRMGGIDGGLRKQYLDVDGVPVLRRAISPFLTHPAIGQVVVVLPSSDLTDPPRWLKELPVVLVAGGRERSDSVWNGLQSVEESAEVVLVHDGARPFASAELISRVLEEARHHGAVPAQPVTDTIKQADESGLVLGTADRARLWRAQTPQGFPRPMLQEAYRRARREGWSCTDDASVLERAGYTVRLVAGDPQNIKITVPSDLEIAELMARRLRRHD